MNFRIIGGLALAALCVAASAQTYDGTIGLYLEGYTNDDGDFEWNTKADFSGDTIYTYCFSTTDYIIGGENTFNVYSLAGSLTNVASIISNNNMANLSVTSFLQAAALAEHDGEPNSVASNDPWNGYNYDIHNVESGIDTYTASTDVSDVWYLQQTSAGGQPQVYIGSHRPGPVPEPFTMSLGLAGVGLAMRRKLGKKSPSVA